MIGRQLFSRFSRPVALSVLAFFALIALPAGRADEVEPPAPFPKTTANDRATGANNIKQIAIAIHNFESAFGAFPAAASRDKNGKPLLSWRVHILPYVEENALYQQFRLDEPWDSKHNKKLLDRMPKVFAPPIQGKPKKRNTTYYQVFTGPDALFNPKWVTGGGNAATLGPRLAQVTDGTSNTALVVEAGEAVPWTKPADVAYDAKKPLPKLGGLFKEGTHFAMADGSVRFIGRGAKVPALRALITPTGGEVIDDKDLPAPQAKK